MNSPMSAAREVAKRSRRGLAIGIAASVLVHGAGVAWALSSAKPEEKRTIQNAIPVQLVKLGKKRDPELLPRKIAEPPPPPPDTVKLDTGKEPPPSAKPLDKPKVTDQLSDAARKMLERDAKLDKALEKVEAEGDPTGDEAGTTTDLANAAKGYDAAVARVLKSNYRLPEAIPAGQRQFLSAKVVLYIEPSGRLSRFEFEEKHPNALFMGALESMLANIQFPPPPVSEQRRVSSEGVLVVFNP